MTTSTQSRQPKGIPTGGQYAASAHAESGVSLDVDGFTCPGGCMTEDPGDGMGERVMTHSSTCPDHPEYDDALAAENEALMAVHAANEARLDAEMARRAQERARWGTVNVTEGSRTPWGAAQHVDHPVPGIAVAGTAGHGGVKLSPERNIEIPPALRNKSGWYEEDCEASIVGMYFPEAFPHYRGADVAEEDQNEWRRAAFESSVKNWMPDEYTKATGKPVTVEESSVLRDRAKQADKDAFRAEHSHEFVTLGNGDTHATWIPDGYAACKARLDDTGEERTFLMPRSEVITNNSYGRHALVDPNRHLDVTDVANAQPDRPWTWRPVDGPAQTGDVLAIDYGHLTDGQAHRAQSELDKQWRFSNDDGTTTVETLGEHMRRIGVVGKAPRVDGDKVEYWVRYPESRVTKVSKAAYDALTSVPDTSDDTDKAYLAKERARIKRDRIRHEIYDNLQQHRDRLAKAEAEYQAAAAAHTALREAKDADGRAWQAERAQMQRDAFAALAAEKGVAFDA